MMKDKELEQLFLAHRPSFDDKDEFMMRLERKLDAVEYLRQYEEANLRRYRYAMVAAFVMGIVVGGVFLTFVLQMPQDVPLIAFNTTSGILLFLEQHSRTFATAALSLLLCFGIISIISNVLDIVKMKAVFEIKQSAPPLRA